MVKTRARTGSDNKRDLALGVALQRGPRHADQLRDYVALKVAMGDYGEHVLNRHTTRREREAAYSTQHGDSKQATMGGILTAKYMEHDFVPEDEAQNWLHGYDGVRDAFHVQPGRRGWHPRFSTANMANRFNRVHYAHVAGAELDDENEIHEVFSTPFDDVRGTRQEAEAMHQAGIENAVLENLDAGEIASRTFVRDVDLEYRYDTPRQQYQEMGRRLAADPSNANYNRMAENLREGGHIV